MADRSAVVAGPGQRDRIERCGRLRVPHLGHDDREEYPNHRSPEEYDSHGDDRERNRPWPSGFRSSG